MCCRSVAVQFGVKIFILAVHFDSFSVEVNGVVEILLAVFIVTLILVNLCNCYNKGNEMIFDFNFEISDCYSTTASINQIRKLSMSLTQMRISQGFD